MYSVTQSVMEYQQIKNFANNTTSQPSKFRAKTWVESNYDACGTYNKISHIKFRTAMLNSSL